MLSRELETEVTYLQCHEPISTILSHSSLSSGRIVDKPDITRNGATSALAVTRQACVFCRIKKSGSDIRSSQVLLLEILSLKSFIAAQLNHNSSFLCRGKVRDAGRNDDETTRRIAL